MSEVAAECERRFEDARAGRDAAAMGQAVLDLEAAVREWSADTEEADGAEQARAVLRALIVRLAQCAAEGPADPARVFEPLVRPLLALREQLRGQGDYPTADALRHALTLAGVDLRDGDGGADRSMRRSAVTG